MQTFSYTILVTKAPFDSPNAYQAIQFCKAAIAQGHSIKHVFFYQAGVLNASNFQDFGSDQRNVYEQWLNLHHQYHIPLNVCISAASRRGIVDKHSALNPSNFNVSEPFTITGISEYFSSINNEQICIQL